MTALDAYQRLEAAGLWRESPEGQRRDVIVSIGDATLVICDTRDRPLTHWSLAAVTRANPGVIPAIYHPDGDPGEQLELAADEAQMIAALEKLRSAIDRRRPQRGRLRVGIFATIMGTIALLAIFWLPGALKNHALTVIPQVKRDEIGAALYARIQTLTGPPCAAPAALAPLDALSRRVAVRDRPPVLHVIRDGIQGALHLPGGVILVDRSLIEDYEDPEIAAGYILAEQVRAEGHDPVGRLLESVGTMPVIRLLTTGDLDDATLDNYARSLLAAEKEPVAAAPLLSAFETAGVRSRPYAYAIDPTGEDTIELIEADPYPTGAPSPVLKDSDWLRLQAICS